MNSANLGYWVGTLGQNYMGGGLGMIALLII